MANVSTERTPPPSTRSPHAPGLAPLEYLQLNQRRGSITDPSLHASSQQHQSDHSPPRHPLAHSFTNPRYSFPPTNSPELPEGRPVPQRQLSNGQRLPSRTWGPVDTMDTDPPASVKNGNGLDSRSNLSFLPPPSFTGSKRKMSHDRQGYQLHPDDSNGSGYPGYLPPDIEGPNPKRRSSTFEANNRIAQLSLQDRRDSVDSRSSVSGVSMGGAWNADRRDSVYSTTSMGSNTANFSNASPGEPSGKSYWNANGSAPLPPASDGGPDGHRPPRTFAFPQDPVGNGAQSQQQQPPSQFVLNTTPPIPSVHFSASAAAARRLSIPESSLPLNAIKPRARRTSRLPTNEEESVPRSTSDSTRSVTSSPTTRHSPSEMENGNYSGLVPPNRKETPYSRSPELRVSHKMAERKRRKEMKDLFDELREQLPADRGMKASKWEILSKAVDYIAQLKVAYTDMSSEIERLRGEADAVRPGGSSAPPRSYTPQHHHQIVSPQTPDTTAPLSRRRSSSTRRSPPAQSQSLQPKVEARNRSQSQSPYASHHQTPTPQQPPQPLPQNIEG